MQIPASGINGICATPISQRYLPLAATPRHVSEMPFFSKRHNKISKGHTDTCFCQTQDLIYLYNQAPISQFFQNWDASFWHKGPHICLYYILWDALMKYNIVYFYVLLTVLVLLLARVSHSYTVFLPLSQESIRRIYFWISLGILKNMFGIDEMISE